MWAGIQVKDRLSEAVPFCWEFLDRKSEVGNWNGSSMENLWENTELLYIM